MLKRIKKEKPVHDIWFDIFVLDAIFSNILSWIDIWRFDGVYISDGLSFEFIESSPGFFILFLLRYA